MNSDNDNDDWFYLDKIPTELPPKEVIREWLYIWKNLVGKIQIKAQEFLILYDHLPDEQRKQIIDNWISMIESRKDFIAKVSDYLYRLEELDSTEE